MTDGVLIQSLSDFFVLAGVTAAEFRRRIPFPVMVFGMPRDIIQVNQDGTNTVKPWRSYSVDVEQAVIPLAPRAGNLAGKTLLGRGSAVDVPLPFETISRCHAELTTDASGQLVITDLSSKNGTFVNDARLKPNVPQVLGDGARLKLGDIEGLVLTPESFLQLLRKRT